ncbi:MAG: YihY/virulence factor BrkB family protein [Bacteroidales bacterium]|nr:YihY/virulence factor BrkB family protein [Bacteroidales bacterium]MDD4669949.1 YihY/virulence factor BrkB family protein [Bacteroidales bacterium]
MARLKDRALQTYNDVRQFITIDIWRLDFSKLSKVKANLIKHLKILIITLHKFFSQRIGREAVALSYFGMMALVPMVAVILFVSNGFGLDKALSDMLFKSFPTSTQLINVILGWANNIIVSTNKGAFGWISFLTFVWLVIWLMLNIEQAFNRIWNVEKSRSILKRVAVYFTILFLAPFVLLLFLYGWAYYARFVNDIQIYLGFFSFLTTNLFWVIFYGVALLVLSLIYKFIPHAKVSYRAALKGAIVSAAAFIVLQYLYMETQLMVTRLSAVYGAFAAVPLFMVWMNFCWFIILFGAELSYGFQHVENYDFTKKI